MAMQVRALTPVFGAEIIGLDVAEPLAADAFRGLREIWHAQSLLLIRGQSLDETALVRFSRGFGTLESPPASAERVWADGGSICPEIWVISNVIENGKPIGGLGAGEAEWHTDMSYIEEPPSASLLYAREIPPAGGDTAFASMHAALEAMPLVLRAAIEGRRAKHDSSYTSAGELRRGASADVNAETAPGGVHPIIRTHPETGRKAIYLGRRRNGLIVELPLDESEAVLDEVWRFATQLQFTYRHHWRLGDLLVWDNRALVHRRDAFDPEARRIMLRTQVKGDRPR
ncbi:MAG: TauD/TfdA family dioxygenase [Proteobacteria bacterium]|nr:TauD/TfdA family dioxygenase [Pseudomonadota bacterium]MBI3496306.1 TauD/TfdA family dioxygenase [Pseudomonadota bacterium]